MTEQSAATPARPKLSVRAGVSRKLLERKAAERAADLVAAEGAGVESCFPAEAPRAEADCALAEQTGEVGATINSAALVGAAPGNPAGAAQEPASPPPATPTVALAAQPASQAAWSDEDESAFQALARRRAAAGRGGRGRVAADPLVGLGALTPNPGTVIAVIVGLVAERGGSVAREALVTAMAGAIFPHGKARPTDRTWCQGYVAGAVRNGFLVIGAVGQVGAEPVATTTAA